MDQSVDLEGGQPAKELNEWGADVSEQEKARRQSHIDPEEKVEIYEKEVDEASRVLAE